MEGPKVKLVVFNRGEVPTTRFAKEQGEIYCHEVLGIGRLPIQQRPEGATLVHDGIYASIGTLDIACLGRSFQLGMLYDCCSDCLVADLTLWEPTVLQKATDQRQQTKSHFELLSDDNLTSKIFHLDVQANLKLSVLMGLVSTTGSAKFLNDHKSFNKHQARVTLKYSSTTRFRQLTIKKLGAIRHPILSANATHVVMGVLYGAEAFFVFDQEVAPTDYQTVHENMQKVIKSLPNIYTATGLPKVQCTVYSDFQLPGNPTSFQDAAKLVKNLPELAERSTALPIRVTLYPLSKLHSSVVKLPHEISPALVTKAESFVETFYQLQMQCNDLLKMISSNFPAIQKQLSSFQNILTVYKSNMIKQLACMLPLVRSGEIPETNMGQIFKANDVSPFKSQRIVSWLNKKEHEISMLTGYLNNMKEIPFVTSPSDLNAIVHNFEYDFVLCFSFTGEEDAYLQHLSVYCQAPQPKKGFDDALPKQWHEDIAVVRDMRSQARQFKDFVKANRNQQVTKFIVSSCVNLESSDNKGAVTVLFKAGGLPEKFLPPSQPGKVTATKVTSDSILLAWDSPKCGAESVQSYTMSYCMENDPTKQWKVKRTQDSGNTTMITQLTPKTKYRFKVHAQCEVGVSPESEVSDPIETGPNYIANQLGGETQVSPKPMISNPPASDTKVSISCPGKPNSLKVTSNSVHLNWHTPKSGSQNIEFYSVLYRRMDDPSSQWETVKTQGAQEFAKVSGLTAKAIYCFKVRAECEGGVSPDSDLSEPIATSPPPVPGRPGKPTVSKLTHDSIHVNWPGPKSGIEGVKFYSVLYHRMDDPSAQWQTTKTEDSHEELTVSGLAAKAVYCFKVCAECNAGVSPDSELSDPIATSPPPVPGRPGKPTVSKVTHDSIHLNWPGPESGIEGVTFYSVMYRRMDKTSAQWQTTKTQDSHEELTVTGLAANCVYCFKVRAESEAGNSPDSEMCDPIGTNPPPVPGKPGKPTASKITHSSIHLNWPGPKSGIEGVKFYSVLYRRMDNTSAQWQTTKTEDSQKEVTVSGLAAQAVYCFKVCAECESGVSPDSELSDPVATSPLPLPGKPGVPTASKVTHNSVDLNWSGPESFAEGVKYYLVSYRRADDTSSQWQTLKTQHAHEFITVSGLVAKAVYAFKVCAECETGCGAESKINQITTSSLPIPSHPGKPNALVMSHNTIKVNWSHPQYGAENVKYYTVSYCKTSSSPQHWEEKQTDGATESLVVTNLNAKTEYCFKVRADSEAGVSRWSEVSPAVWTSPRPPPSQPGKPYFLSVSHDTVVLKWNKPQSGAQDLKHYSVSYYMLDDYNSRDKWKWKKTEGLQESVAVTGLKPRAIYCFNVYAESDAGCSSSSESSDPITLHAPPAPSQPGKPTAFDNDIIHNSILLNWAKPARGGEYVKRYSILYRRWYDPADQWQTRPSDGPRTALTVSGLDPKTEYHFKVHAMSDTGISVDSEVSVFHTKAKVRPAEGMLKSASKIEEGPPAIYKLKLQEVAVDKDNQLKKFAIGKPDSINSPEEKVIMVLGATGAGKTTLINGMTNYLLGVEWGDDFRFKLIVDEVDKKASIYTAQAESQTKWITAYTFHHQMGSPLPYTLTIIDTPGFGDTEGPKRDCQITEQIRGVFSMPPLNCIDYLNAIAFVTQAALARLTPTQKYIFDSILAIFGKDIASNIFMMATFADGGVPPVLAAIKAAGIPSCELFKFNNSSLWARPNDHFGKMFWKMGLKSFEDFFAHLKTVETRSLRLTREVLDGLKHLDAIIQDLLLKGITTIPTMEQKLQQRMVCEAQQILARLDGIALKPHPLNELDYIDLLIESEKQQCKPGYQKRLEYLQEARKNAKLIYQLKEGGIRKHSEVGSFHTKTKFRLAEEVLPSAILIEKGPPKVYKLKLQEVTVDKHNQLKKCAIGKPDSINSPEEKVIMVLGATGAGKTTLINGMTNYLLGVEWGDDFRFKLIVDEVDRNTGCDTVPTHCQTKWITAYTFHHQKGSLLPYTLTIIDTPGFGDTGGPERDYQITEQIRGMFSMPPPNCIHHLDAIAFVTQAALARLTPTQKYIFDSILAIFGKDIASNIFMMATFADGGVPPVLAAIKAAGIPSCELFKFNNSSLWARPNDHFGKMFWKMGLKSFEDFFAHLKTVETRSLRLTREVLDEHEHLETVIQGLLPLIQIVMSTMDKMQQEEKVLERDKIRQKVKDLQQKVFEMICQAHQILAQLDEIALKPNPLTEVDYIDLLIESEKQQCKPGYMKRLEYLQDARKNAKLIYQINKGGDAPQWLKDAVQKAKENTMKHSRSSQSHVRMQPPTAQTRQYSSRSRWWPFQ